MKTISIEKLLNVTEGRSLELKKTLSETNIDPIGKVICSFLNTQGGYLVCGIDENNNVIGINIAEDKIDAIQRRIYSGLSPKAPISFEIIYVEDKRVLTIEVPHGKDYPYSYKGDVYTRDGIGARKADIDTIKDLILRREIEPERWERRFSNAGIEDLSIKEVSDAVESINSSRMTKFRDVNSSITVLEDLAVAKYGKITNAGDILFCIKPSQRNPQARVKVVRYHSDITSNKYKELNTYEGPLVSVLEDVFDFIIRNTPVESEFSNSLEREDNNVYPLNAVREGLVNAFVHRDYSSFSGSMSISIYPNRLEIWKSGS